MTDIYIDPSVAGMPDAADHLAHLPDTGHRLIFVGDCPTAVVEALHGAQVVETMPEGVPPGSWHVSADPAICGTRTPGLLTLRVGPRLASSPGPSPRCDAEARDLASAVLEILGRDAMG
jgi:hypothetical protein